MMGTYNTDNDDPLIREVKKYVKKPRAQLKKKSDSKLL